MKEIKQRKGNRRSFIRTGSVVGAGIIAGQGLFRNSAMAGGLKEDYEGMDIWDVFHTRRSVRKFKPDPIPEAHIEMILNAARTAPTSGNQQPWKFLVIRDRSNINLLGEECVNASMEWYKKQKNPGEEELTERHNQVKESYANYLSAPVYIVVLTDSDSKYPAYNVHDGPLAAGYLILAARALGYGTVYITDSIPEAITRKVFSIPERFKRICITPVGIPETWPDSPQKKELGSFVITETF